MKKASDGQPVEFRPAQNVNDRHVIYFNYDSIVDFSIGVKNPEQDTLSSSDSSDSSSKKAETLNAYIEGKIFLIKKDQARGDECIFLNEFFFNTKSFREW